MDWSGGPVISDRWSVVRGQWAETLLQQTLLVTQAEYTTAADGLERMREVPQLTADGWQMRADKGPLHSIFSVTIKSDMIRFSTAGESHGEALIALVSGLPAGVPVDLDFVNRELWRRQQGYGRGGRMKIETDKAHVLCGVRHGKTIGSPIAIEIVNRDWKNWEEKLPVEAGDPAKHQAVASPRPGHADLAGALKYNFPDARYVLERASARESTARVAAGAFAKLLLRASGH